MIGAPKLPHETLEQCDLIIRSVDQRGREMDERWGVGRLPMLVSIDVAERFRAQRLKFSRAAMDLDPAECRKHGDAMLRAYAKLDELAVAAHGEPAKPEQWEFTVGVDNELIILVRDIRDAGRADTGGRQCQVWSLDEIASVIRNHPIVAAAKEAFPGAIVESVRPDKAARERLDDELEGLPL